MRIYKKRLIRYLTVYDLIVKQNPHALYDSIKIDDYEMRLYLEGHLRSFTFRLTEKGKLCDKIIKTYTIKCNKLTIDDNHFKCFYKLGKDIALNENYLKRAIDEFEYKLLVKTREYIKII